MKHLKYLLFIVLIISFCFCTWLLFGSLHLFYLEETKSPIIGIVFIGSLFSIGLFLIKIFAKQINRSYVFFLIGIFSTFIVQNIVLKTQHTTILTNLPHSLPFYAGLLIYIILASFFLFYRKPQKQWIFLVAPIFLNVFNSFANITLFAKDSNDSIEFSYVSNKPIPNLYQYLNGDGSNIKNPYGFVVVGFDKNNNDLNASLLGIGAETSSFIEPNKFLFSTKGSINISKNTIIQNLHQNVLTTEIYRISYIKIKWNTSDSYFPITCILNETKLTITECITH